MANSVDIELLAYLRDAQTESDNINVFSILQLLVNGLDSKNAHFLLKKYDLLPKNLSQSLDNCCDFNPVTDLNGVARKEIETKWQWIIDVVLKPWLAGRSGIAADYQLQECLEITSKNAIQTRKIIHIIRDYHLLGKDLYQGRFIEVEPKLYVLDSMIASAVYAVKKQIHTYFYKPTISYPIKELIAFLIREFSLNWEHFSDNFIHQIICLSRDFRVSLSRDGEIIVFCN